MSYDLFSPAFKANPFPTLAALRAETPLYAHQAPNGSTVWYITRFEDGLAVLKDNDHFVKDPGHIGSSLIASAAAGPALNQNMLFSDPPAHTRLRGLVSQAFTARRVEQMSDQIQAMADELLDRVQAQGEMDLIGAYALPLPVNVIGHMLGIPAADRQEVCDWSQAIISPGRHRLNYSGRRRRVRAFLDYVRQLLAERRQTPRDDLITALVQAEAGGDRLSETELSSMIALLLVTGHETTVNLIGNGVLALLQQPAQLAQLRQNPALIDNALEELLRYDGPVETSTTRWARLDVEFRGHLIRQGDVVRVVLISTNRDPAQFSEPDRLDLSRPDCRHLAFGHGSHYCLGAPLARLEGRIALTTLCQRLPDLHLAIPANQLQWRSGVLFRGLERLPVAWRLSAP
jgi:cytochrome P450